MPVFPYKVYDIPVFPCSCMPVFPYNWMTPSHHSPYSPSLSITFQGNTLRDTTNSFLLFLCKVLVCKIGFNYFTWSDFVFLSLIRKYMFHRTKFLKYFQFGLKGIPRMVGRCGFENSFSSHLSFGSNII